jgi:hypothetical protein
MHADRRLDAVVGSYIYKEIKGKVVIFIQSSSLRGSLRCTHFSNVALVVWVKGVMTAACCVNKLVWYSCIDDGGERNFEITHASKKLAFDSHNDKSLDNFAAWSSVAPKWMGCGVKNRERSVWGLLFKGFHQY